jgi:multidrug efflux pump subunit AcrA (membrane-fusion protein)
VLTFENKEKLLGPGLFVRLRFPGGDKYQTLLVPQESIGTDQGQKFVYVVNEEGVVDYRRVEPGALQEDGWRAVRGNLKAGEKVIVDGLIKARVGEKVETSPWMPEAATTQVAAPSPTEQ